MSRQARSLEQIRTLLRQMDRSVDDARARREGTTPEPGAPAPTPTNPSSLIGEAQQRPLSNGPAPMSQPPVARTPITPSSPLSALGGAGNSPPGPGGPPRVKAKPKKSGSSDPLQDFQQRQAS